NPNNPAALRAHGSHFIPSAVGSNGTIIDFLGTSITTNVAQIPVSATSGGITFRFEGGTPVPTSRSAGPIFGERAQTLGRGRMLAGANSTGRAFSPLRGVDLHDSRLTFTHEYGVADGSVSVAARSCTLRGRTNGENEA